ncbi:hypothetical protein SISNIDRAFT_451288 [Sistotremastrum niveocremeum HHB9708]|uniref:P-loop containing nucleoside triphosphate hydrolase protein n=1 Tax=Sistotremastrum niveocremeum HHB9708 TaxID=1314777 RepID=A0A164Y3E5_9AGAM|nr:hypothetical protein SISNIDRAFT_451288 [Sistotremastrum niveocremeum HHB9708]
MGFQQAFSMQALADFVPAPQSPIGPADGLFGELIRALPWLGCLTSIVVFGISVLTHRTRGTNLLKHQGKSDEDGDTYSSIIHALRLVFSLILLTISGISFGVHGAIRTDIPSLLSFGYATFTSVVTLRVSNRHWQARTSLHTTMIYLAFLTTHTSHDLLPLMRGQPNISFGLLHWVRYGSLLVVSLIVPAILPRHYTLPSKGSDEYSYEEKEKINPALTASYLSLSLYSFLDRLILQASRLPTLEMSSLPPVAAEDTAEYLGDNLLPLLDPTADTKNERRSLIWKLFIAFRIEFLIMGIFNMTQVNISFPPNEMKYIEKGSPVGSIQPWVWILWLALGPIIAAMASQYSIFVKTHAGVRIEAILTQLIFDQPLFMRVNTLSAEAPPKSAPKSTNSFPFGQSRTSSTSSTSSERKLKQRASDPTATKTSSSDSDPTKSKTPKTQANSGDQIGLINNLLTVDLKNVIASLDWMIPVIALIRMVLFIWFLYNILGWSAFVGISALAVTSPLPGYTYKVLNTVEKMKMKKSDERLQSVIQTVDLLRMIKLFAWEDRMAEKIDKKREEELKYVWKSTVLGAITTNFNTLFPLASMMITYTIYTLIMRRPLTASVIFPSITVFDMCRAQFTTMDYYIPVIMRGRLSLRRIENFLRSGETIKQEHIISPPLTPSSSTDHLSPLLIRDMAFAWETPASSGNAGFPISAPSENDARFWLRIDGVLEFYEGGINIVCGATGVGKTSLLMALLGEMHQEALSAHGCVMFPRDGGVSYAAQESWVMNGTIRDNILFQTDYDAERYKKVLHQTALERDIELFDAGDHTEIGEKGITLSGAVYSDARILLLDDILSSLDAHTSQWIVDKCLMGDLVRGRTVILVTHNIVLTQPIANRMILISGDGQILTQDMKPDYFTPSSPASHDAELSKSTKEDDTSETVQVGEREAKSKTLIGKEEMAVGRVSGSAVKLYVKSLGHPAFVLTCGIFLLLTGCMTIAQNWFIVYWTSQYEDHITSSVPVKKYLLIYGGLLLLGVTLSATSWIIYRVGSLRASRTIHKMLVQSIFTSTFRWLDTTPVSRITTRCSQDMQAIDTSIPALLHSVAEFSISIMISIGMVVYASGWIMLLPAIGILLVGLGCGHVYMKAQLPVKRLMSNARAPLLGHMGATLHGIVSIRAYGAQERVRRELKSKINDYSRTAFLYWDLNRWIGVRMEGLGGIFAGIVAAWLLYGIGTDSIEPGMIGFILRLLYYFSKQILAWVRMSNDLEVNANSLERVQSFLTIEHEAPPSRDATPPAYWPASGDLNVNGLSARYSADGPDVLKDISFSIKSGERVGIVGRTGAGKSSLALSLLRALPMSNGTITFDGFDINALNLSSIRSNITIIPQHPELMSGTIRENLDPFGEFEDADMNAALKDAGLSELQREDGAEEATTGKNITLDLVIQGGGSNLSLGQRQIIALARAFMRKSKVIIIDEGTAAIDHQTDDAIQSAMKRVLRDVTTIIIAHRLESVMDADKIMVLDEGRLIEFDTPQNLLRRENSSFRALVERGLRRHREDDGAAVPVG